MDWLLGRKTPQEILKQNQRALSKAQRDLDRERQKLEQQEKKLISDIKTKAKQGQMGPVKIMAKDLVRTRRYIQQFYNTKTQLQALALQIQTFSSNQQMATSIKGVTKALKSMNSRMHLPQIQKIMMDFERESEVMDMKGEMLGDAVDDALEDDEEESEDIVNQVLDEIGIEMGSKLADVPQPALEKEDDLQQRLASLRKE
ncbi:Snf7 family [Gorgonomyces haynaldii]|nr:Snf7 family [Gorgonomyces haynaldii]